LILPLLHFREDVADTFCVLGIVLKPVHKQHRVPIDSTHDFLSVALSGNLLAA